VAAGAEVIGVSRDDTASHAKFREHHRPPLTLLSDPRTARLPPAHEEVPVIDHARDQPLCSMNNTLVRARFGVMVIS